MFIEKEEKKQGFFARRRSRKLLDEGLIDFVSSDAHNITTRSFCLASAHDWLTSRYGTEYADALCGKNIARLLGL